MALPKQLQSGFLPSELSFIAENEIVSIIPRQQLDAIELIDGPIPRMRPPQRAQVPLWLALLLKKQKRATIVPPSWLSVEELEVRAEEENRVDGSGEPSGFSALPYHWIALSDLILDAASDDVPDADTVRRLLRDLRETRQAKAREGLEVLEDKVLHMDNIGATEINEIRGIYSGTMDLLRQLQETRPDYDEDGDGDREMQEDGDSDG
ncbi:DNA replication complex GINS protein psf2 [Taphrina deformans PYCC 5710]|uniref:DNA replication complex GINS protein PSF2 n=1 Tax=Taphrina deformans (strain PYCC 5710 / ATCC 11124 / CBS 356.35 / IMI 108563 / JCM 9778 / NBRC 8474) TaxID=1097556 RepID=R4XB13_TAPDE|nr:DNA replication complex GINS protein psf2 [Taphrina deformans PYCC 5710]|eukprot:CCG81518.1 DNA replication complex GINS protein psf2 [Taphrina deformans PYCC 5710]